MFACVEYWQSAASSPTIDVTCEEQPETARAVSIADAAAIAAFFTITSPAPKVPRASIRALSCNAINQRFSVGATFALFRSDWNMQ